MSEENNMISLSQNTIKLKNGCPENTIGDFCVPCRWIFGNCEQIKICTKENCVCSAGYQTKNKYDCYYACDESFYGHGCQEQCSNCYYETCHNIYGTCPSGCKTGFMGPKCDKRPGLYFVKPPEVEASYNTAIVKVENFTIEKGNNENPSSYYIQYKVKYPTNSRWRSVGSSQYFFQKLSTIIEDIQPDTEYYVRAVITSQYKTNYNDDYVKFSEFTTKCDDVTRNDITTKTSNNSVFLSIKPSNKFCKMDSYNIQLLLSTGPRYPNYANNTLAFFNNLDPFTKYQVFIKTKSQEYQVEFQTKEGVPDAVSNIILTDISSTKVEIKWTEPNNLRGEFKHYIIQYYLQSFLACNGKQPALPNKMVEKRTFLENIATIDNLTPYAVYVFSVSVANTALEGPYTTKIKSTSASDNISSEELPSIKNIIINSTDSVVELDSNCEKIQGPILVRTNIICSEQWCTRTRKQKSLNMPLNNIIYIDDLTPFSNYTLQLEICRDEMKCSDQFLCREFKTKSSAPGAVRDLSAYSKNQNSVSLRWRPPFPPKGILKNYKIDYHYSTWRGKYEKSSDQDITQCILWSDFHCATISNLKSEILYTFNVYARNEEPWYQGEAKSAETTTIIEPSNPPYDLRITWTDQNDLELTWKHPNQTNGEINYFAIDLDNGKNLKRKRLPVDIASYKLIYKYNINHTEIAASTKYQILIAAYNGLQGRDTKIEDTSPPDIPKLTNNNLIGDSINNHTANVIISPGELQGKTNDYRFIIFISDKDNFTNLRQVFNCTFNDTKPFNIIIGDNKQPTSCEKTENPPLQPATQYNITVMLKNSFAGKTRETRYSSLYTTEGIAVRRMTSSDLLGLLALLLVIPIIAVCYLKRDKIISIKNNFRSSNNTSTEFLEIEEDQIPLSTNLPIQIQKKPSKIQSINPDPKSTVHSKPIKITEFEDYVKNSIKNGELQRQHALFPRGQTKPWNYASLKENKPKNRYNNLLAYDHSRVILQKIDNNPHSDYINANYIDGHKVSRAYIATQGPKKSTLDDFWRMIWQENVKHIANVANIYEGGKKKVEQYWPDINQTLHFGQISVEHVSSEVFADYEHRIFNVTANKETRKIEQLHFTSWPDHGVPLYSQSLVPFLQKILQIPVSSKSPIVVHCSAGVGRTGTILLCDICLRMAAREGSIDILKNLHLLREQRANMVDNVEQYKLAHLVILECLVGLHTDVQCNEIGEAVERLFNNGSLLLQMRYLKDTKWQDETMKLVGQMEQEISVVKEKNRFENIIPEIQGRVFLSRYPPEDENSSYINAVKVDGFRCLARFIVTQQPLPNTLGDFWRLIDESNVTVIVSLNEINLKNKTSYQFWPTIETREMNPVSYMNLKYVKTLPTEYYDIISIHLKTESRKEHLLVQIFSMKNWPAKVRCPPSIEQFLNFWEDSDSASRQSHPAVITCYDGVTASGLYVALSFIIEKMKLEQICNVCQAVRSIRHNREQFVQDLEQFEFLYRAAVLYINGFKSYANFN